MIFFAQANVWYDEAQRTLGVRCIGRISNPNGVLSIVVICLPLRAFDKTPLGFG